MGLSQERLLLIIVIATAFLAYLQVTYCASLDIKGIGCKQIPDFQSHNHCDDKCRQYNTTTSGAEKGCCDYGCWYDDVSGYCRKVHTFLVEQQQMCFKEMGEEGTTKHIREVFIGRCWMYQIFKQPEFFTRGYIDCEKLFHLFTKAFANKTACGEVNFGDYKEFIQAAHVKATPTEQLLFWSGIKSFSKEYASRVNHLFTLEKTLVGFILDDLRWCGQKDEKSGINFVHCPPWKICEGHAEVIFWEEASQHFAKIARNEVSLLLNGSLATDAARTAFSNKSFFADHELKVLSSENVSKVKVILVHSIGNENVTREACNNGSLVDLWRLLNKKGFNFICEENPADVQHLLCSDKQGHKDCRKKIRPKKINDLLRKLCKFQPNVKGCQKKPKPKISGNFAGKIFGYSIHQEDDN